MVVDVVVIVVVVVVAAAAAVVVVDDDDDDDDDRAFKNLQSTVTKKLQGYTDLKEGNCRRPIQ